MGEIAAVDVPRRIIEEVLRNDPSAQALLDQLDIAPAEYLKLGNILDHNHKGAVNVLDMLNGLQRLRGSARRGDIISVQLTVEGMQEQLTSLRGIMKQQDEVLQYL